MHKNLSGVMLAIVAALLMVGIGATYRRHAVAASRPSSPSHSSPSNMPRKEDGEGFAAGQVEVVRFASNASPAPPFLVPDLSGQVISTSDWHGKVVLLNFWATWCPPCREEIPELTELATRYKDQLLIVGVAMDDSSRAEVAQFVNRFRVNYPIIMGSRELVDEYGGVPALPTSFIIDPDGRVVQKHVGLYPIEVYETEIRALLGMPVEAKVEHFQDTGQIFLKNAALATELPGVDLSHLTAAQKKAVLKRLNSENCNCGCGLTLAQCRINDTSCPISRQLAAKVVKEVLAGTAAPAEQPTTK